jgi:hypothetical protein
MLRKLILASLALIPATAWSSEQPTRSSDNTKCYDAEVSARIVAQIPSIPPEFEDGSIVMRWPWFIDLDVRKVRSGEAPKGLISTLAVQHTYWRKDLGTTRWYLRRNSQGGFNLLGRPKSEPGAKCASGKPPARAYLGTTDKSALDALRREGEARYGRSR